MGRILGLLCVAAASYMLSLPALPDLRWLSQLTYVLAIVAVLCCARRVLCPDRSRIYLTDSKWVRLAERAVVCALVVAVMMTWVGWRAELRLQDQLDPRLEDVVTRTVFRIQSMVRDQSNSVRFAARVLEPILPGVTRDIEVAWRVAPDMVIQDLVPGQVWRAALILRSPRGLSNPHGFDYEGHAFARNVRAIGRVRGIPAWQRNESWADVSVVVSRVRQAVRTRMRKHVGNKLYGAVLIALAIGDQDSVQAEHWRVFNLTGITHLVSISGSHVTMIAAMGGALMLLLGRRLRFKGRALCEWIPARVMAASASVVVALGYCLLAGWGVPAQRTFFMLLVVCAALILRLAVSVSGVLCFAATVLVVLDPWAPLATGFWLSFGAVAVLFSAAQQVIDQRQPASVWTRVWFALREASRLQWLITVAMTPTLAFLFQQVSLTSPFANALAIPVVTFIVTPLALLVGLFSTWPVLDVVTSGLAWCAHAALHAVLIPVTWLAQGRWSALDVAAMPVGWLLIALLGTAWALFPAGVPVRWTGWGLMLPALAWQPPRPAAGDWTITALDVGQGAAILVRTATRNLLFDTGPPMGQTDAGQRVVIPTLRALGVRTLDALVLSHADADHTGGLRSVMAYFEVSHPYASFDLSTRLQQPGRRCTAGDTWQWDGVTFTFLHPQESSLTLLDSSKQKTRKLKLSTNAQSCVLKIAGQHHAALLPGDLPAQQERALVKKYGDALSAEVVVAPHHGSATSSSAEFVQTTRARHVVALVGHRNRFQHPDATVQRRWRQAGAIFWRADLHGAITVYSQRAKLIVKAQRDAQRRYWHPRH
jgi:competence protein ComEC